MTLATLIPLVINISLFVLVFALGLKTTEGDLLSLFRRPTLLGRSLLAMNVAMLAFAVAAALMLPLPPAIKIALVALAVSPVPPILPTKQARAGGTASYAIGLLVAASAAAIAIVPIAIGLLGPLFHADYRMPVSRVATVVLISVILPLALGAVARRFWPERAARLARPASLAATVLLVLACLPVVFTSWAAFWALVGNGVVVLLVLFTLIGLAVGHFLGGPDGDNRTVLALATGTRHPGVAIAIASLNFPDEKAAAAVILWHLIVGTIVSVPYVRWRKREHSRIATSLQRQAGQK
jgi:BASS family bile acid:Na+ symporter